MLAMAFLLILPSAAPAQRRAPAVLIDNLEAGVGKWTTNDGLVEENTKPTISAIYAISPGAANGGGQAGLVEFAAGRKTWASVSREVSGSTWVDQGCTGLALSLKGDGSRSRVDIVLRSYLGPPGARVDTSFIVSVALSSREWRALRIPFSSFRSKEGAAPTEADLRGVKLLQFVKTGTWSALRFSVDEVMAQVLPAVTRPDTFVGAVLVDFDRPGKESLLRHGVCLGSDAERLLGDERFAAEVTRSLALLGRTTVRVRLSDFYVRGEGQAVRTSALLNTLAWVRSVGCEPLLCLDQPLSRAGLSPAQGWREFGALCGAIASRRAGEAGHHYYEIGSEPLLSGQFRTVEAATTAYNSLAAQVRLADPTADVGGMGFASPWDDNLKYFVEHARELGFLSFHFYGAHSPIADDEDLFKAAHIGRAQDLPHQASLAEVRELVKERGDDIEVWVTECALNSAREANGSARDKRIQGHYGAAWLTAFSLTVSPYVDRVLWFKAWGHGWGLLQDDGSPTPAFHAAALFSQYAPPGATVGTGILSGSEALIAPVTIGAGRYAVVANTAAELALQLQLNGTPAARPTRTRRVDPTTSGPTSEPTSPTSTQKLNLRGPGLAIIEAPVGE